MLLAWQPISPGMNLNENLWANTKQQLRFWANLDKTQKYDNLSANFTNRPLYVKKTKSVLIR